MISPNTPTDDNTAPGQRTILFTVPSSKFFGFLNLWSVAGILWVVLWLIVTGLEAAALRAKPLERCWETLPGSNKKGLLMNCVTALAATLLITMLTIIVGNGLGRVYLSWLRFWYWRNWLLVAISFIRGFALMRREKDVSGWAGSFLNSAVFLCFAQSTFDIVVLITQARTQKVMFLLFILSQLFSAFVNYVIGSSLDNPCDRSKLSSSTTWFIVNKIQASVLVLHSIYYLQVLIRVKLFEGITVPIINFSTERFSVQGKRPGQRFSRLSRLDIEGEGGDGASQRV